MKLRKLYIDDYKIFKKFSIDFTDKDNKPLDIIVLAGINGSGKTTILEHIFNIYKNQNILFSRESYLDVEVDGVNQQLNLESQAIPKAGLGNHENNIEYFPVNTTLNNIKDFMPLYIENMIYQEDARASEIHKLIRDYVDNVFKDLNMSIRFDSRDGVGKLYFRNKNGDKISIDNISTGEKTLISKVLYLYFKGFTNKVILIDEPELSLHPTWQSSILRIYEDFANKNNCQIIIATHSPHIIGSAKSEWIRLLTEDGVIDNISKSYGLEFDKVLTDIMGLENLRTPDVAKQINKLWEFLEDEDYSSNEYKNLYKELEHMLGNLDKDLILARLEVAKLKSQNA